MSVWRYGRHPLETIRTAPLGVGIAAIGLAALVGSIAWGVSSQKSEGLREELLTGAAVAGLGFACSRITFTGVNVALKQIQLRERLEAQIERIGFNERVMGPTLPEWCDRQTAIVACEQFGPDTVAQYRNLIDQNRAIIQLPNLPHCYAKNSK